MRVLALANQKGGVGKTTTAVNLAAGLHGKGKRVLLVDMDPQSNAAFSAGVDLMRLEVSGYDVFKGNAKAEQAIEPVRLGYDVITGGLQLAGADMEFTGVGREFLLAEMLEPIRANYDYCIIDSGPQLGVCLMNALTAANEVIIPVQPDAYALQGMRQLFGFIRNVQKYANKGLKVAGLLVTRFEARNSMMDTLEPQIQAIAESMGSKVYKTKIRATVAVPKAALERADLYQFDSRATAAVDYAAFVDEFLSEEA